jgi:flagellar hook protein FlgE
MYSGVAGLQAHKGRMDVIGNDIANVNTIGYKQSDVSFKEAFVTTLRSPLPGAPGIQTGLGVQTASISRNFTGGTLMETGNTANLALSGNGFFVVSSQSPQAAIIEADTNLQDIAAGNANVYDLDIDINGATHTVSVDLRPEETAQEVVDKLNQQISGTLQSDGFAEPATGWITAGGATTINLQLNGGSPIAIDVSNQPLADGDDATVMTSHLNAELLAVDPTAAAAIQFVESPTGEIQLRPITGATIQSVAVQDTAFAQDLGFTSGNGAIQAADISDSVNFELNLGMVRLSPKIGDVDFTSLSMTDGTAAGGMSVLGFSASTASSSFDQGVIQLTRAGDFVLDTDGSNTYLITSEGRRLQGVMGNPPAAFGDNTIEEDINLRKGLTDDQMVTSYAIGLDGSIRRAVDGSPMEVIGQVALANPDNPPGLNAVGSNLYEPTEAASLRNYSKAGTKGASQIFQGYVENSNVDLASEFTEMIITQRGFQANSKTISTSDEMLQELIHLKR